MKNKVVVAVETNLSMVRDGDTDEIGTVLGTYGPFTLDEAQIFADKMDLDFEQVYAKRTDDYRIDVAIHTLTTESPDMSIWS